MRDHYEVLKVRKDATTEEIKTAYERRVLKWHPDKHPNHQDKANKKFREISKAYEVLSNAECRRNFDQTSRNHRPRNGHGQYNFSQNVIVGGSVGGFSSTTLNGLNIGSNLDIVTISGAEVSCSSTKFKNGIKITTLKVIKNGRTTTKVFENDVLKSETVLEAP